jgi:hypothetical protein
MRVIAALWAVIVLAAIAGAAMTIVVRDDLAAGDQAKILSHVVAAAAYATLGALIVRRSGNVFGWLSAGNAGAAPSPSMIQPKTSTSSSAGHPSDPRAATPSSSTGTPGPRICCPGCCACPTARRAPAGRCSWPAAGPSPARRPAPRDICPHKGRARLG